MRLRIYQAGLSGAGAVEGRIRLFCIKMSGGFVCQGCHPGVKQPGRLNQPRSTFSPLERLAVRGQGAGAAGVFEASLWLIEATFSLCLPVAFLLCVSVSYSPFLIRTPLILD